GRGGVAGRAPAAPGRAAGAARRGGAEPAGPEHLLRVDRRLRPGRRADGVGAAAVGRRPEAAVRRPAALRGRPARDVARVPGLVAGGAGGVPGGGGWTGSRGGA